MRNTILAQADFVATWSLGKYFNHAFALAGSTEWCKMLNFIHKSSTLQLFKINLKTYFLFIMTSLSCLSRFVQNSPFWHVTNDIISMTTTMMMMMMMRWWWWNTYTWSFCNEVWNATDDFS